MDKNSYFRRVFPKILLFDIQYHLFNCESCIHQNKSLYFYIGMLTMSSTIACCKGWQIKLPKPKIPKAKKPKIPKIEIAIPIKKLTVSWIKSFKTPLNTSKYSCFIHVFKYWCRQNKLAQVKIFSQNYIDQKNSRSSKNWVNTGGGGGGAPQNFQHCDTLLKIFGTVWQICYSPLKIFGTVIQNCNSHHKFGTQNFLYSEELQFSKWRIFDTLENFNFQDGELLQSWS